MGLVVGKRAGGCKGHCTSERSQYAVHMRWILIVPLCVTGCGLIPERWTRAPQEPILAESHGGVSSDLQIRPQVRPLRRQEAAVSRPVVANGALGRTVASLGNAAEPGLWLKTPLVQNEMAGQIEYTVTGKRVTVTLIPIDGPVTAGSRVSLQAMQALGVPLTGLLELEVVAGG